MGMRTEWRRRKAQRYPKSNQREACNLDPTDVLEETGLRTTTERLYDILLRDDPVAAREYENYSTYGSISMLSSSEPDAEGDGKNPWLQIGYFSAAEFLEYGLSVKKG